MRHCKLHVARYDTSQNIKSQIPLRYLVRSWSATGFEPASVMEFGFKD